MTHANENNLELMLVGLKLEKYIQLFSKKAIKFDTFVNMTAEDMESIGIKDKNDQRVLLENLRPLLHLYKDINELPDLNDEIIIGNTVNQLRNMLGLLIVLRRILYKQPKPKNTPIDTSNSIASAIVNLISTAQTSIKLIESDMRQIPVMNGNVMKKKNYIWISIACGSFLAIGSSAAMYFLKK